MIIYMIIHSNISNKDQQLNNPNTPNNIFNMDRVSTSLPRINNPQQDQPFVTSLRTLTKNKYLKMLAEKKDTPSLVIPRNFQNFIKTQLFLDFLMAVHAYTIEYHNIHKKYRAMEVRMMERTGKKRQEPLEYEKVRLEELKKRISYYYSTILLKYSSRVANNDQLFFEALLYLISKVIKEYFEKDQYTEIEQEVNRLFRTDKYNIIQKRHENDQLLKKYPILKESITNKLSVDNYLNKIYKKKRILSTIRNQKKSRIFDERAKSFNKQDLVDVEERSPIVSVWLGSNKYKMSGFIYQNHAMGVYQEKRQGMEGLVKSSIKELDATI